MKVTASLVKDLREKTGAGMLDCKKALEATDGNIDKAIDYLREKGISKAAKKADRIAAEGISNILINGNKGTIIEVNSETDYVASNDEFKSLVNTLLKEINASDVTTLEDALKIKTSDGTLEDQITQKTAVIGEKLSLRRIANITKSDSEVFGSYIHMGGKIAVLVVLDGADEETAKNVAMHAAAMRPKYIRPEDVPEEELNHEKEVLTKEAMNEGKPKEIAEKIVKGRLNKFYKEICLEEQAYIKDPDIDVKTYVKNNNGTIKEMYRFEVGEGIEKKEENFAEEVAKQMKA